MLRAGVSIKLSACGRTLLVFFFILFLQFQVLRSTEMLQTQPLELFETASESIGSHSSSFKNDNESDDILQPDDSSDFLFDSSNEGNFSSADLETKTSSPYRLKIGDMLLIAIYGEEATQKNVVVDPTGSISYLFLDPFLVSGKTMSELRQTLEEELKSYYRYPLIAITPVKFSGDYYSILGEVSRPGRKLIEGNATVLSALCDAGGFTMKSLRTQIFEQADLERSFLARDGEYVPVDFEALVKEGDLSKDIPLEGGDFLYIEKAAPNRVYVLGEVSQTLTIEFMDTLSLAEVLTEAGGVTDLASSRAVVLRGSLACPVRYLVDINRILKGYAADFLLKPGDIVYIPPRKFTLMREIVRGAIRTFVASLADRASESVFFRAYPHAKDRDISEPVNVIGGSSFFFGP